MLATEQLCAEIVKLNANAHGILLQHPVPSRIDERRCLASVTWRWMNEPAYGSATPAGIMRLLRHYSIPSEGKHAVVVGIVRPDTDALHSIASSPFNGSMFEHYRAGDHQPRGHNQTGVSVLWARSIHPVLVH